ncbi:OmpA family protein [Chryseobacterium sp. R2A-55]|uniref:OmpA family protein n=1 Tax=Chryseobacterium sp. R2A-55 TaxID=2744445 RepID=UPI001F419E29|nr:OmpA family protein [Chryseobacterium sp. R2A-55]
MALNIIDLIKGQLGSALISQAASQLGESESGVSKAISGLLPAVVGGLANNADQPGVIDSITGAASSGILGNLLGASSGNSLISTVLSAIFGDKAGGLVNAVSTFSGVSNSSSHSLLNLVTGATLGSLGKYVADNHLDASGISSLLQEQKGIVSSLLPAGLTLASLGLGNWGSVATPDAEKVLLTSDDQTKVEVTRGGTSTTNVETNDYNTDGGSIWKWLLPLLLLGLAGWFLWTQFNKPTTDSTTTTSDTTTEVIQDTAVANAPTAATTTAKSPTEIDLNGIKLKGNAGGMEESMIAFLKSDGYKNASDDAVLKDKWYNFDNVNFKMGSSTELEPGSQEQIDNLVAILKAYPEVKIKIGGYTDKTGDEAVNLKISQSRAEFIKAALVKAGVGAQVSEAEGYGSKMATVPASASDAERAKDRKMAVRFTK